MLHRSRFLAAALLLAAAPLRAAPPPPKGDPAFWSAYFQALLTLRSGRYTDAAKAFSPLIDKDPDPHLYLARAVAETLAGDFQNAHDDFSHAHIDNSREPLLWASVLWAMSGIAPDDNPMGGTDFYGMPGHMAQGRDDYDTLYGSCICYELADPAGRARKAGKRNDPALEPAKKKAAAWFANRYLASEDMASLSYSYARTLFDRKQFAEALDADNLAKTFFPADPDVCYLSAEITRRLGRPETARREFTVALTANPAFADGYRGRALAAAAEGDSRRTLADLATLSKLDPAAAKEASAVALPLLSQNVITETPQALLAKLEAAAAAGKSPDDLFPTALALQRASAMFRLRYDEIYQDKLRALEAACAAAPTDPEPLVALATYLLDELDNRGESVEPGRPEQMYRVQASDEQEARHALDALQRALKLNPKHVGALVRLAYAYDALGDGDAATKAIDQVLALAGTKSPDAVRLLAMYQADQVAALRSRASSLRTPTYTSDSHTENRSDGVYRVTRTTRHDPSNGDLVAADACDRRANALVAQARQTMQQAIDQSPDSLEGLLLQAAYQSYFGTPEKSLAAYQQAVAKFPTSLKAHDALLSFAQTHGLDDVATEQRIAIGKLVHTSAGPALAHIWKHISPNGWPTVRNDIPLARQLDPADARGTLYLAYSHLDARQPQLAAHDFDVAIALERARIALDDQGESAKLPRPASDLGLLIRLLDISAAGKKESRPAAALADARRAADLARRFAPGTAGDLVYTAMVPDPRNRNAPIPDPVNAASLAAIADVTLGQILQAQGKSAEAFACFQHAAAPALAAADIPRIGGGADERDTNYNDQPTGPALITALIEIANDQLAHNDVTGAQKTYDVIERTRPAADQGQRITDLYNRIMHARQNF
jgi:tetratricopeptide (TPR) repeat protein